MGLEDYERGKQLGALPPLPHDPGYADFMRGQAEAEARRERHEQALKRVQTATAEDFSHGYGHAFKALSVQTVFWTGLLAGGAALIAWRLHAGRGQIERSALGAGGLVLAFCLFFSFVTLTVYTVVSHFRVVLLLLVVAALVVAGAMAVGVVPKVW